MLLRATRLSAIANAVRNLFRGASLNMNFAGADTLDPRITFTRASGATRVNASGVIEAVAIDGPRFDYDPVTLAPKGLLIEEQRTNLLTYSSEFDNAAWVKSNLTVTPDASLSPAGAMGADQFVVTSTGNANMRQPANLSASTAYTFTVFCRGINVQPAKGIALRVRNSAGTSDVRVNIRLDNATAGAPSIAGSEFSGASSSLTTVGNGWLRATLSFTSVNALTGSQAEIWYGFYGGSAPTDGDIYLWGAQLEVGAFPTSYIPTTTAAATRAADVATMTGANFSNWYRQDEGTLFAEASTYSGYTAIIAFIGADDNNRIQIAHDAISSTIFRIVNAGVGSNPANIASAKGGFKAALAYKQGDAAASASGSAVTTASPPAFVAHSRLILGQNAASGLFINGHIRRISYFPRRLSNSELEGITK